MGIIEYIANIRNKIARCSVRQSNTPTESFTPSLDCSLFTLACMIDKEAHPSRRGRGQVGQAEQGRLIRLQEVATHNICSGPERSVWTIIHDKVLVNTHLLLSAHAESEGWHCRCTTSPRCWGSTRAARNRWWRRRPAGTPQRAMRWSCT